MKKKTLALLLAIGMLAALAAGCGAPAEPANTAATTGGTTDATTGDELIIGGLAPLTGDVSVYGIACNNGAMLAVEEANAAGKNIKYVYYDEKGDATEAVNAYNKLVENDKIVALVGDVTSKPSIAVAQIAAKDNMPMISGTATADDVTKAGKNVFRACFTDPFQGEVMANYAKNKLAYKKAAILYNIADDYSVGLTESFRATAKANGLEVVADESYTGGDVDFKSQLTKIAGSGAECLFVPVYYQDVALIAAQAKEVGFKGVLLGADGWEGIIKQLNGNNLESIEGAYYCGQFSSVSEEENVKSFVAAYTEKYGEAPSQFAALGYDAMNIMLGAIDAAGSTDKDAIIAALQASNFKGVTGAITFDENGTPIKTAGITTIAGGEYKFVENYK